MSKVSRDETGFDQALDAIYVSFMSQKHRVSGKLDKDVRDPTLLIKLAQHLNLLPPKERIIRITGSKGKGTTSRMIAHILQAETDARIGLFVSPEELDHNDRMRVNGWPASKQAFVDHFTQLQPHLNQMQQSLPDGRYLSPMGTFLLIALSWFKEQKVDYYVLETGRGARHDEVGILPSKLAVLTSILFEHPSYLGPELSDIADNKLAIGLTSELLIADESCLSWNRQLGILPVNKLRSPEAISGQGTMPLWFHHNQALAHMTAEFFLNRPLKQSHDLTSASAAFGSLGDSEGTEIYFDACIAAQSLDLEFFKRLQQRSEIVVVASLPDDKDGQALRQLITKDLGCACYEISLSGTRGYLHYQQAKASDIHLAEIAYDNAEALRNLHNELVRDHPTSSFYYLGTQTFIRLVRKAFSIS